MNENERCPECGSWGEECAFPSAQAGCGCARCLRAERDEARAEVERLTALTEESEHQMHLRIRAGYDKTVADAWRAALAKMERERDEARAALRTVAERQREACEKYAFCQACANAVGGAPLVTEEKP